MFGEVGKVKKGQAAIFVLIALFCTMFFAGCGGGGGGTSQSVALTREQIAQIDQTSQAVSARLAAASNPGSDAALQDAKQFAETQSNVASASVVDGNLVVQYKDAGQEIWAKDSPTPTMPADIGELTAMTRALAKRAIGTSRAPVGNRKAVLINALSEDPAFVKEGVNSIFDSMKEILEACSFQVTSVNGPGATPDKLASLSDCSVFVQLGHGGVCNYKDAGGHTTSAYAVQTGKPWDGNVSLSDWRNGKIVKMTVDWGDTDRENTHRSFYAVTGRFWTEAYANQHLNHALFFNCACSGAKYSSYRSSLYDIGVAEYSGWTEPQGKSFCTAWRVLLLMAGGKTMQQAVDALPDWYKSDLCEGVPSSFWYGPDSERSITLSGTNTTHPAIAIDAPFDGENISGREVTVRGQIVPNSGFSYATVSVNGQSEALSLDSEGRFEQPVGLRSGSNVIKVSTIGNVEHSETVTVNGDFSSDILFTTLWWKTDSNDVDLHLRPVEGADGAVDECFFARKITSWGAALDVDDVNGFGPEHITARSLPAGKYRLYVHYFDTHGQINPVVVNVAVSANGEPSRIFSLSGDRRMTTAGDIWNVCDIEYPSGRVTVLDEFIPAVRARKILNLPSKK